MNNLSTEQLKSKYPLGQKIKGTRLTPVEFVKYPKFQGGNWGLLLKCDCGKDTRATLSNIAKGATKSCGCLTIEANRERAFTFDQAKEEFLKRVAVGENGCWIWTGCKNEDGYGQVVFQKQVMKAHRASWIIHRGEIPQGKQVLHNCPAGDTPACVNPAHLWLGTHLENMADCAAKGRIKVPRFKGSECFHSPFVASQVEFIRQVASEGFTRMSIANYFGVSRSSIDQIVNRQTWKYV